MNFEGGKCKVKVLTIGLRVEFFFATWRFIIFNKMRKKMKILGFFRFFRVFFNNFFGGINP
jgi:hypothetical protein